MAKSCIGGESVWVSMGLWIDCLSHSDVHLSSGMKVW